MIVIRNVKKESKKMNEPIAIKNPGRDGIGFAVDLGTTTIAMTGILLCDGRMFAGKCADTIRIRCYDADHACYPGKRKRIATNGCTANRIYGGKYFAESRKKK